MPNLLAMETSSPFLSVAVKKGKGPVLEKNMEGFMRHGENLIPFIDQLLKKSRLKIGGIDFFLIGRGPGSFTGLRVGFATLKGFLAARKKPCGGALSLDLIAHAVDLPHGSALCVCLDARRQKIYARIYERKTNVWRPKKKPGVLSVEELLREFPAEIYLAGDGLARYGEEIKTKSGTRKIHFLPQGSWYPKASTLIRLFKAGWAIQTLKKPKDFLPLYFRLSEAEEKRRKHHAAAC